MNIIQTTGLDPAPMIPVGATVAAATWHVAGHYGPGEPHATERDALAAGIAALEERIEQHAAAHGGSRSYPERMSIDLRWRFEWERTDVGTTGMETTVRRTTYPTLGEAREHLARIDKYAKRVSAAR